MTDQQILEFITNLENIDLLWMGVSAIFGELMIRPLVEWWTEYVWGLVEELNKLRNEIKGKEDYWLRNVH